MDPLRASTRTSANLVQTDMLGLASLKSLKKGINSYVRDPESGSEKDDKETPLVRNAIP